MSDNFDMCNDGNAHQWRSDPGSEDGMVCGGCGVSEAELDHLWREWQETTGKYQGDE